VQTHPNAAGCDSIITLHLTVQQARTQTAVSACGTYAWKGGLLTASGTYFDTLTSSAGCDSIVQLQLTLRQPAASTLTATICEGSSFESHSSTGIYTDVFLAASGCDSVRTLHLTVTPRVRTTVEHTLCAGDTYAGYGHSGTFTDTLRSAAGCDSIRTMYLKVNPVYHDTLVRSICEGESFLGHTISGTYTDRLQSSTGCDSLVTTHLTVGLRPHPQLPADTTLCLGTSLVLRPTGGGPYQWQDGSSVDTYLASSEGVYTVTATNACGSGSDAIRIAVVPCTPYFPTAFSPNGDGRNDRFRLLQSSLVKNYHLTVYNRWGKPVFSTTDPHSGWDGTFRGQLLETGVFVWHSTYTLNGKTKSDTGTVLLMR
jgi:gliding motility-associated-like protein